MFSILFRIITIPLIILSFWFSSEMSIIILIIYGLLEIIIFRTTFIKAKPIKELKLTSYEEKIFSEYYIFFKFPVGSVDYSVILSTIQFSTFILTPLFLFKELFIPAIILGINYFLVSSFVVKLNPILFMRDDIKKGNMTFLSEYETIQVVIKKISNFQKEKLEKYKNKNKDTTLESSSRSLENASQENKIDTYEFLRYDGKKVKITIGYDDKDKADIYWKDIVAGNNFYINYIYNGRKTLDCNFHPEETLDIINKKCPKCGGIVNRFYYIDRGKDANGKYCTKDNFWGDASWMEVCFKCKKVLYFDLDSKE